MVKQQGNVSVCTEKLRNPSLGLSKTTERCPRRNLWEGVAGGRNETALKVPSNPNYSMIPCRFLCYAVPLCWSEG